MRNQHKIEEKTEGILWFDHLLGKQIKEMSSGNGNIHYKNFQLEIVLFLHKTAHNAIKSVTLLVLRCTLVQYTVQ